MSDQVWLVQIITMKVKSIREMDRSYLVSSGEVRSGHVQVRSGLVSSGQSHVTPGNISSGQVRPGQLRASQAMSGLDQGRYIMSG